MTQHSAAARFIALDTYDIRFPTSRSLDGSDAMNPDPDYSAAYLVLRTDADDALEGHGFTFTIGRGNDVQVAAINALREHVVGRSVDEVCADPGSLSRTLIGDSQLRWLGPEKGVMHMAIGAVINAVWDLAAKREGKPLWQLLADADPEWLASQVDYRYLTDALTYDDAVDLFRRGKEGAAERAAQLRERGYPAYTTSPGWLGYSDEKLTRLAKQAIADGFTQIKLKVGADLADDIRRMKAAREAVGPDVRIAIDANQRWDVLQAVAWIRELERFDPYWIEEPTSPDDVLGHSLIRQSVAPVKVATGEHVQNRVVFKQLHPGPRAGHPADRLRARRRGQREPRHPAAGRQVSTCPCARTRAVSGCASSSSTCPCSTTSRFPAPLATASSSTSTICTSTSWPRCASWTGTTPRRARLASPPRCTPPPSAEYTYPDGTFWSADLASAAVTA